MLPAAHVDQQARVALGLLPSVALALTTQISFVVCASVDMKPRLHRPAIFRRSAKGALQELYSSYARGHDIALRQLRAALTRSDVNKAVETIAISDERVSSELHLVGQTFCR